jgi:hypothetical protein
MIDSNKPVDCLILYDYQTTYLEIIALGRKTKNMSSVPYKEDNGNSNTHHLYGTIKKSPCHGIFIEHFVTLCVMIDDPQPVV